MLVVAVIACTLVHLLAIAGQGMLLGLPLSEFRFGFGPVWLRAGRLSLGGLPLGGYVRFGASTSEPPPQWSLHPLSQLSLALAGVAALLAVSIALIGRDGLAAFAGGFRQFLVGAASPLDAAQAMLVAVRRQVVDGTFAATLGLVAAKLAAMNLMPFPRTNGWEMLAVAGRRLGLASRWPEGLTTAWLLAHLAFLGAWLLALVVFLASH